MRPTQNLALRYTVYGTLPWPCSWLTKCGIRLRAGTAMHMPRTSYASLDNRQTIAHTKVIMNCLEGNEINRMRLWFLLSSSEKSDVSLAVHNANFCSNAHKVAPNGTRQKRRYFGYAETVDPEPRPQVCLPQLMRRQQPWAHAETHR